MAVIAISEQIGSGGIELGRITAERMGYRFMRADEVFAEAAQLYKVTPDLLRVIDEREPGFWEWLRTDVERLYAYFRAVTLRHLSSNNIVIAGRSISLALPEGVRHGLRVRVVAPIEARARRVRADEKLGAAEAERRVRDADRETQARILSFRNIDLNNSAIYDLVINTGTLSLDALAHSLAECARKAEAEASPDSCATLADACITAQVRAALFAHPKIGNAEIEVNTSDGVVWLSSDALCPPWDQLAAKIVRQIEGVKAVEFDTKEPPIPPTA